MAEYDSVIPAGGSGKLVALIHSSPLRNHRLSKSIAVHTDSETVPKLTLRFSVDLKAPILMTPSARFVAYAIEGEEARQRVLLHRVDGEMLIVTNADLGHPLLETVIQPVVRKEQRDEIEATPGDVWLELVLPADAPVGTRTGSLQLATNHPMAKTLEIPYVARVQPLIQANPAGARLWLSGGRSESGLSTFVNLERKRTGSFTVTGIEVSHPEVFSAGAVFEAPSQRQTIRVELVKGLDPQSITRTIEGWMEIITDDPIRPKLKVPVRVARTRQETLRRFPRR